MRKQTPLKEAKLLEGPTFFLNNFGFELGPLERFLNNF
jgi:hypothetical protein